MKCAPSQHRRLSTPAQPCSKPRSCQCPDRGAQGRVRFGRCPRLRPTPTPRMRSAYSSASPWVWSLLLGTDHRTSPRRCAAVRPAKANGSMLEPYSPSEFSPSWQPPKVREEHAKFVDKPHRWRECARASLQRRQCGESLKSRGSWANGENEKAPANTGAKSDTHQASLACPSIRRSHRGRFQPQQRPRLTTAPLGLSASFRAATHTG